MPKHSSVILATRFCTSKYFKSIFFTYFHKPIAGPLPTRHFLPPDSFCHHHGEKFARKVQFLKNICKFHSLRSSIQISCIYVAVPFGDLKWRRRGNMSGKTAWKTKRKIKDNTAADEGQQMRCLCSCLAPIFGTFA